MPPEHVHEFAEAVHVGLPSAPALRRLSAALQDAKEHPESNSSMSLQDVKRCKRAVPKLLILSRTPPAERREHEAEEV